MHQSEMITDAIYSSFKESELKNQIASLGANGESSGVLSERDILRIAQTVVTLLGK